MKQHSTTTDASTRCRLRRGGSLFVVVATALTTALAAGADAARASDLPTTDAERDDGVETYELMLGEASDRAPAEAVASTLGATVTGRAPGVVQVDVPADAAAPLGGVMPLLGVTMREPLEVDVRPEHVPPAPAQFGPTTGGADGLTNALAWHSTGITGSGVRVGVIDYFDVALHWNETEHGPRPIPGVTAKCFDRGTDCTGEFFDGFDLGGEDHGVAVVESIRDMAPGAEIFIGQAATISDYQALIDWFVANGVQIVSRSLGSRYDGPGDGRGPLNEIAASANAQGILWVNSGGNNGAGKYYRNSVRVVGSQVAFGPTGNDTFLEFDDCANLGGIRWANDWDLPPAERTDYDAYLWETPNGSPPGSGRIIASRKLTNPTL